jgi:hypothetical protein
MSDEARFWCPCFLAWQPAQDDTTTCPAYGCTPALLIVKPLAAVGGVTGEDSDA